MIYHEFANRKSDVRNRQSPGICASKPTRLAVAGRFWALPGLNSPSRTEPEKHCAPKATIVAVVTSAVDTARPQSYVNLKGLSYHWAASTV